MIEIIYATSLAKKQLLRYNRDALVYRKLTPTEICLRSCSVGGRQGFLLAKVLRVRLQ